MMEQCDGCPCKLDSDTFPICNNDGKTPCRMQYLRDSTTYIWVTTDFVALHQWKDAPDDVDYLRNVHRHKFNVKVKLQITGDRQLEYHQVKKVVDNYIDVVASEYIMDHYNRVIIGSCEEFAERLAYILLLEYGTQHLTVCVDEDGECGSEYHV